MISPFDKIFLDSTIDYTFAMPFAMAKSWSTNPSSSSRRMKNEGDHHRPIPSCLRNAIPAKSSTYSDYIFDPCNDGSSTLASSLEVVEEEENDRLNISSSSSSSSSSRSY